MHGVRAAEDYTLVADYASHPLARLMRSGVACSLCADDTLVFSTDLAKEYRLARERLGLTDLELATLARASVTASAAPPEVKDQTLTGIDAWLASPD